MFREIGIEETDGSILDASVVRTHQDGAGGPGGPRVNAIGRSRGGFSTKLHAVVTLEGHPIEVRATPGEQHESTVAEELLDFVRGTVCLADGGYDADRILEALKHRDLEPVIPPSKSRKKNRRYNRKLYRDLRYQVEVFFHHLKRYRRIATRYDKTLSSFMGFVDMACLLMLV
jgi:transposase